MKKITLAFMALSICTTLLAQPPKFGIKGGINLANLKSDEGKFNNRLGFNAGLISHIHISPEWAVQPEVVYSSQGAKYTLDNGEEHDLHLNYVNVPVVVQYMFNNGFRLQTGPQVGFLVNTKDKYAGQETEFFTSSDFKDIDASWTFGLGYLSETGFGIDGRYNLGLTNINDFGTANLKNNVFQVGLFYMFDNRHKAKSR